MANYTLSYSDLMGGWASFYSYYPDWMIGMNNYFYTFKGGDLYRHNLNSSRNTFYQPWWNKAGLASSSFTPSTLQSVFNTAPLENKLFKTISIQGDATWSVTLETDLQYSGYIDADWFQKKEASYFAFIRNNTVGELALRSVNGIGRSSSVAGGTVINFLTSISIGSIISVGDYIYYSVPPYTTPVLAGKITSINVDLPNGLNSLTIDISIAGATPIPIQDAFFLYVKNSVAESHGVLGHYCTFNIENVSAEKVELFALQTEVMKSFP
tara:strand:+ start:1578 stop:2381 length:804 start_codon:yes stop_codon:yes gene_type:complete